ncbi:MAG: hypothetical protein NTZ59_02415 [Bacteroidetes bacterium]|nr:hypothetical protein [Bacteroidota bacterium]
MKKFFNKIVSFLKLLFGGNLNKWIYDHVQPSVEFVQRLKTLLESPVLDVLTALIPSNIDDAIRAKLLLNCQRALQLLAITADIANEHDPASQITKLLQYLKEATPAMKAAIYKQIASEMAKLSGGAVEVKGHSVDLLTQLQYSKLVEGLEHSDLPSDNTNNNTGADNSQEVKPPEPIEGNTSIKHVWNASTNQLDIEA